MPYPYEKCISLLCIPVFLALLLWLLAATGLQCSFPEPLLAGQGEGQGRR